MPKKEKHTFSHFFKEDEEIIKDLFNDGAGQENPEITGLPKKHALPRVPQAMEISDEAYRNRWRSIRSFYRNGNSEPELLSTLTPLVLAPIYTSSLVGIDFPIWIEADDSNQHCLCQSLRDLLIQSFSEMVPGENGAQILKRNIGRILTLTNKLLETKRPILFQPTINQILDQLVEELNVPGDEGLKLNNDIRSLKKALPAGGILLPHSMHVSYQLLEAAIAAMIAPKRKKLKFEVNALRNKIADILNIEQEKGPEAKNPDKLQDALTFVNSMVKFDELSALMPTSGSESMSKERLARITNAFNHLNETEAIFDQWGFIFLDELLYNDENINWENVFEKAILNVCQRKSCFDIIGSTFDKYINLYTKFFRAKRIAELELEGQYQKDIHDQYFENFDWTEFTIDELNNCPPFILVVDNFELFESKMSSLSTMLSNNIPIKILAVNCAQGIHSSLMAAEKDGYGLHVRAELGALMLSYKNIYVAQSTSITPKYLFNEFKEGLSAFAPAFFNILNLDEKINKDPYLMTSSAIESRDFPCFSFKGLLGTPWGARFDVSNNPQPALSWPVHVLTIIDEKDEQKEIEVPFTFADQAVLNPSYHRYYLPVDPSYWSDDLILLAEYMDNSEADNIGKVPFIWMVDDTNALRKVAVSWPIVIAAQERLDFWRFLQENSGINNYHVSQAVEQVKQEIKEEHALEINRLKTEHEVEIEKIRKEEASKVMENLASVLLNLETTNVQSSNLTSITPPPITTSLEPEVKQAPAENSTQEVEEQESIFSSEPYIDTALCTSCNECTNKNGQMFKYNANKMAYIADANAGTFRELVEAAEICPVGIIHPGSPLNPDEEDLENLIKRAAKFN